MLIETNSDAREALLELQNDITNTINTQVPQIGASDGIFGFFGLSSPGSSGTRDAANSLLAQLAGYAQDEYAALDDSDTPLTSQQVAKLKLIRTQVQDARSTVQSTISDLDWSFGTLVSDSVSAAANLADRATNAVVNGLGLNWTVVKIGGGVLVAALIYAAYRRVRG